MNGNSTSVLVDQNTYLPASTPPIPEGEFKGLNNSNFLYLLGLNTNWLSKSGQGFIYKAAVQSCINT